MRDLCSIFEELERQSGEYQFEEYDDFDIPFSKVLDQLEQEELDYDEE